VARKTPKPSAGKKAPEIDKAEPKRSVGRPFGYSNELADQICMLIAEGRSLRSICRREDMPERRTVLRWLQRHEEFCRQYARARELQADWLFDEILEIADDSSRDFVPTQIAEGVAVNRVDHEHIHRSRLRVDTRKWMVARLAPKKYGDRIAQEISGFDGAPLSPTIILTGRPEAAPEPQVMAGEDRRH
jgi:hypothetical protein